MIAAALFALGIQLGTVPATIDALCPRDSVVSGVISSSFRALAAQALAQRPCLVVSSTGGSAEDALVLAAGLVSSHASLRVVGPCLSSCSQILVPAARSVALDDGALLGFHTDYAISDHLAGELGAPGLKPCGAGNGAKVRLLEIRPRA